MSRAGFELGTSDFALAVAAAALAAAAAWEPGVVPWWLAAIPMLAFVTNYAVMGTYQALVSHQWWTTGSRQGGYEELEAHEQFWAEFAKELDAREKADPPSGGP